MQSDDLAEDLATAIIAAIDGDDMTFVRVETEAMEDARGGAFFDVTFKRRTFTVLVMEAQS